MTCKIKRRSLRCGGRPKADFGSIFTTFIAPALGVAGSVADSAISKTQVSKSNTKQAVKETNTEVTNNNNTSVENLPTIQVPTKEPISGLITSNTIIPSDPTKTPTMRLGGRKKCWVGAAIGAATSIAGSLFGNGAKKREMRRQKSIQDWQTTTQEAAAMSSALNNSQDYQEDYLRQFRTAARLGKTLGAKGIYITDGGDATKIGNNTYLLRGGSHEDVNETGQTGIGINVGGNEIEAEGGEVAQKKNGALRIFSAQPILGGISPAQAVINGASKDKVFNAQQQFKRRNHLSDGGNKYKNGGSANKPRFRRVKNYGFTDATPYPNDEIKPTVVTSRLNPFESLAKFASRNLMELGRTGLLDHEGLNVAQDSYLVPTKAIQAKMFADAGYIRDYNAEKNRNYGLVKKGVGNRNIPIYSRTNPNFGKQRKDLVVLGNNYNIDNVDKALVHAGSYPSAIYSDNEGNIYINSWDLNDYGADAAGNTGDLNEHYGSFRKKLAKAVDVVGNPTVVTTGYQRALDNNKPIKISNYSDYYNLSNNGNNEAIKEALDNWMTKQGVELNEVGYGSPLVEIVGKRKHRLGGRCKLRNGGLTSKDRGSSKHPYPSVSSKDFAGGGRSYPIPTKADAVDALKLAGLHGRSDVKAKVYSRYPELRPKARNGAKIEPYYDWARNTSSNLGISFIDPTYDYRAYYNSVTPYERALIRFAPQGTHFTDIGKTPKHPTFSNESKYSNYKTPGGTWNGNVFVPNIWQFGNNGNNRRNKYMNNSGEGYFNGRVNVFPTSRKRHRLGCRTKLRNGGWKAPVYNTNKYRVSNRMRQQIETWEGSDFAGQNRKFNGDAIGAKEKELRQMMGRTYNYLTDNQRDSLNSIYYNSRVDTFKNRFGKWFRNLNDAVDKGDERAFNNTLVGIRQSMNIGENRKGMSGLAKRRAWERNWFGNPIPMDSNETKAILKQQAEARMVQPTDNTRVVIQPEYIEVPAPVGYGVVPVGNTDPNLLQGNIKDNLINMGTKFRLGQRCGGKTRMRCGGSTRMRKALGGYSRPVKGMRPKAAKGIFVPYNKRYTSIYDAPDYNSDYNGGNVLGNGEVTVTAKRIKPTFMKPNNDAMNIINHPANETPYIPQRHNRSRTIFSGGDYLGLGIDTLAALSTGLVNYNTAGKYTLPDRAPIIKASKLPTIYNVNPEIEEVKRYRDRLTGQTFNNTSSSVAALNRSGAINLDALSNLSKLWATKENEENKMLTQDALNQQNVAAQNVQNELARQSEIARIKNEANQAKGDALNVGLSGLSQAWTNFWTAGRTAYEDDQSRRAMIASSKDATPTRLMEMDFDLSPDVIAALYRTSNEYRTKRFYLSRLSPKQRQKYGIN